MVETPGEQLRNPEELAELSAHPGLCATCMHLRLLRSPRSTFARCARAETDASFPRYPRLPVVACGGHEVRARFPAGTEIPLLESGTTAPSPAPRSPSSPDGTLHITNGESVLHGLGEGGVAGEHLSWADVLHDGPVPRTATLGELSEVRARALAGFGWGSYPELRAAFARRDAALARGRGRDEVVLWFEHDLFDQLQLLQLLDWFATHGTGGARLTLIEVGSFPGVDPFHGLGQLRGEQLASLLPGRRQVTARQLATGSEAWGEVRSSVPLALAERLRTSCPELPFLAAALRRLCEEHPSTRDGLARSERQVLRALSAGPREFGAIYRATREMEDVPWGDASILLRVAALAASLEPAIARVGDRYELTSLGRGLLAGEEDWVRGSGGLDRWVGGVHHAGTTVRWRWDEVAGAIVAG